MIEAAEDGQIPHLGNGGHHDHEQAGDVGHDAERSRHDQLAHGDGRAVDLRLFGVADARQVDLVVLEEALGHLHGVRDRARRDDHRNHENQRIEVDPHPAGEAETPEDRHQCGDRGDHDAVPAPEVEPEQQEDRHHRQDDEHQDLVGVLDDPSDLDRLARDEYLEVAALRPARIGRGAHHESADRTADAGRGGLEPVSALFRVAGRILDVVLDLLDVVEDRGVDLAIAQPVGHETRGDQRATLVTRDQAAEDDRRVLPHQLAQRFRLFRRLRQLAHQHFLRQSAVRFDLDDAGAAVRDGSDLVVVDRVGRICLVQDVANLLDRVDRCVPGFLGLVVLVFQSGAQIVALARVTLEADAVDPIRHLLDLGDDLGREDRAVLDHDRDGDQRRAAEHARELVLRVDVGVVREEGARVRVDAHLRPGQVDAERAADRGEDRVREEGRGEDQEECDGEAISRDEPRELQGLRLARLMCFCHGLLSPAFPPVSSDRAPTARPWARTRRGFLGWHPGERSSPKRAPLFRLVPPGSSTRASRVTRIRQESVRNPQRGATDGVSE